MATNVYFGDGYGELSYTTTPGYNPTMIAGAATGNQTFTRSGGVTIPISVADGYPGWTIKATALFSPFNVYYLTPISVTSTTVVIESFISSSAGQSFSFQFWAFDWNNINNWYANPGSFSCCCGPVYTPGYPNGSLPTATDNVVFLGGGDGSGSSYSAHIVNGPSGVFAGTLTFGLGNPNGRVTLEKGNYSGNVLISYANYGANRIAPSITGGTYSGNVILENLGWIAGGLFTKSVTRSCGTTVPSFPFTITWPTSTGIPTGRITGGTYSPIVSIPYSSFPNNTQNYYPTDPGFAIGGGVFSPTVNLTGLPSGAVPAGSPGFIFNTIDTRTKKKKLKKKIVEPIFEERESAYPTNEDDERTLMVLLGVKP